MTARIPGWFMVWLLCLAVWPAPAAAQRDAWTNHMQAGIALFRQGEYADAEPLYKRSLAIREKARGPTHVVIAVGRETTPTCWPGPGAARKPTG